ncbi:unnamed protein product [Leptidea sinapis]|uniref:EB domain-containing protein n=1 Tax=Leptidea sinapis TaxID=189913 RepID=A0A5E4Q0S6_9NEOP|nr:unnamed protein product [Leptidea sinapis]
MGIRSIDVIAIFISFVHYSYTDHILPCNTTLLEPCPGNQLICKHNECVCDDGFVKDDDTCVPSNQISYGSLDATAAIVTIFTIALVVVGLVLVARKYNLIEYVRQKINLRRNPDVMYEDVMIGQDDPPLRP